MIRNILLILTSLLLLNSCGYTNDAPPEDASVFVSKELDSDCTLDPEQFKNILDKDIKKQIECLTDKFQQFTNYVKTSDRTVIDQGELQDFVTKFFSGNADTIIQGLGLIFELNMILLGDESTAISTDNITPLFELLLKVNKEAMIMTTALKNIVDDKERTNFWENREILDKSIRRFSRDTLSIITIKDKLPKRLNIKTFLEDLDDRLGVKVDPTLVDSLIFLKKLFLGGDKYILTSDELVELVVKSPKLIMMAIDLSFTTEKNFSSTLTNQFEKEQEIKKKHVSFYQDQVRILEELISPSLTENEEIFNIAEIFEAIRTINDENKLSLTEESELSIDDFENIIRQVKIDLIGGHKDIVTVKEFKTLLSYTHMIFESVKFSLDHDVIIKDIEDIEDLPRSEKLKRKKRFQEITNTLVASLKRIATEDNCIPNEMAILNFVKQLTAKVPSIKYDVDLYEKLLAFKKLTVGGSTSTLSRVEFYRLLDKLKNAADIYFDVMFLLDGFDNDVEQYKFFLDQVSNVRSLLHDWETTELIMSVKDVLSLVEKFFKDINATQFEKTILYYKAKILQGQRNPDLKHDNNTNFTFGDIQTLLTYAKEALQTIIFTDITYSHPSVEKNMEQPGVIKSVSFPNIKGYGLFENTTLTDLKDEFTYIAKNYRYFPNFENFTSVFSSNIVRNKEGFIINNLTRWLLKKVARGYAIKSPNNRLLDVLTVDHLSEFLLDTQSLLEAFDLWTKDFKVFAENIVLLSDLFQNQADGDNMMNVDEAAEFVGVLLSSISIMDASMLKMKDYCAPLEGWPDGKPKEEIDTGKLSYEPVCFRSNFLKVVLVDLGYKKYLPKLYQYYAETSHTDLVDFVESVETFARDVPTDSPTKLRDATLVMGSLLNIESTFVRFDENNDNQLTDEEMEEAFHLYKNSIMKIANLSGWKEKLTKTVLFYMVKYKKIPGEATVVAFYLKGGVSDIFAKRLNVGSLLKSIVENR